MMNSDNSNYQTHGAEMGNLPQNYDRPFVSNSTMVRS